MNVFQNVSQIKVLIVDDDVLICETLFDLLTDLGFRQIKMVHSRKRVLEMLSLWEPDLILLDIRMESNDDGLIIGTELQKQKIPYIYVTAHTDVETMKKVLETNPHGFISKPIRNSELTVNIGLVIKGFVGYASRNIKIKVGNHVETIDLEDIIYIKSDGNYLEIFTDNKKHLKRCTIDQILEELDSPDFERIHRSIVVNKSYIQKVTVGAVILSNEVSLPVSRTFSRTTKE